MRYQNVFLSIFVILLMLIFQASAAASAVDAIIVPVEWHNKNIIVEKNTNLTHIIFIASTEPKSGQISQVTQYSLTYFGDGQAYNSYGYWNLTGQPQNGTVKYYINPTGSGNDPILTVQAVKKAMDKWDDNAYPNITLVGWNPYNTSVYANPQSRDGRNVISWSYINLPYAIAMASTWVDLNTGEIFESDIIFNTQFRWGISADSECVNDSFMDIQNIATHEIGHFMGLTDIYPEYSPGDPSKLTMFGYSSYGETTKRSLEFGDIYGIKELYEFHYVPPPPPPPPPPTSIILNPSFHQYIYPSTTYWTFYTNGAGVFDAYQIPDTIIYYGRVNLTIKGNNNQLYQQNVSLEPNTWYNLSFKSRNDKMYNQTYNVKLIKHGSPYTGYGLDTVFTTPANSTTTHNTRFQTTGFSSNVSDGRFMFYFNYANNGDQYQFTDIMLDKSG